MKVQVVISNKIYLATVEENLRKQIKSHMTFENEDRKVAKRIGRYFRHLPEYVYDFEEVGNGSLIIPRGYLKWLLELFETMDYEYELIYKVDNTGAKLKMKSDIKLRDYQNVELIECENLIVGKTGSGKTITAAGIIDRLEKRTLWVTHNVTLAEQTAKVLGDLFKEKVHLFIGAKNSNIPYGTKIVVGTYQTMKNHLEKVKDYKAGLVIVDECHLAAAATFLSVVRELKSKYIIGLTATPNRKDKKEYLLDGTFGNFIHLNVPEHVTMKPKVEPIYTNFIGTNAIVGNILKSDDNGYLNLMNKLLADKDRFNIVCDRIRNDKTRFVVVGSRVDYISKIADELNLPLVTGNTHKDLRRAIMTGDKNFVCTTSIIQEGIDIPELETLFIVTPMKGDGAALSQLIGRVSRFYEGKEPRIVDFVDYENETFKRQWYNRRRLYHSKGMNIPNRKKKSLSEMLEDLF